MSKQNDEQKRSVLDENGERFPLRKIAQFMEDSNETTRAFTINGIKYTVTKEA